MKTSAVAVLAVALPLAVAAAPRHARTPLKRNAVPVTRRLPQSRDSRVSNQMHLCWDPIRHVIYLCR